MSGGKGNVWMIITCRFDCNLVHISGLLHITVNGSSSVLIFAGDLN